MATSCVGAEGAGRGRGRGQGKSQDGNQTSGPAPLPTQFILEVRDLSSAPLKQHFRVPCFRLFCKAIMELITLFSNVKQISYTEKEGLPTARRTVIITDQIVRNFMHNKTTNEIETQLYPDLPKNRPPPPEPFKPPQSYTPSNVYPNPFFSVSFAMKVANQPPPRPLGLRGQFDNPFQHTRGPAPTTQIQSYRYRNPFPPSNIPKSLPHTQNVPEPIPPIYPPSELPDADSLSFYQEKYYLPRNPDYAEDLLNMVMDPVKNTILIICSKVKVK